jgi:hypothetical protein
LDEAWKIHIKEISDLEKTYDKSFIQEMKALSGWEDKLKELIMYAINDLHIESFSYWKEFLESLYEKMTWEKKKTPKSSYIEYQWDKLVLFYDTTRVEFNSWCMPYTILSHLYHSNNSWKIALSELFKKIHWREYREYAYEEEKKELMNAKDGINRRFRDKTWKKDNIIQFDGDYLLKLR